MYACRVGSPLSNQKMPITSGLTDGLDLTYRKLLNIFKQPVVFNPKYGFKVYTINTLNPNNDHTDVGTYTRTNGDEVLRLLGLVVVLA